MRLAIDGGEPVRSTPFPAWPQHDDSERQALIRVLEHGRWGRLAGNTECPGFEAEFAEFCGAPHALAVTNGTHALQLAMDVVGVGVGDEVIIPAYTPSPVPYAVRQRAAVPVAVDVDASTYCLDPALLDAACTERTRAVIAVHLSGHVADVDAILDWAGGRGVAVIQDCAHAHGARWKGRRIGELGTVATYSFTMTKVMTAGEGGALLLPDEATYADAFVRHTVVNPRVHPVEVRHATTNYRLTEFAAALLRAQLRRYPAQLDLRARRAAQLADLVSQIPGVSVQGRDPRCTVHTNYMFLMLLDADHLGGATRDQVVEALRAEGLPIKPADPPVYRLPAYWDGPGDQLPTREQFVAACPVTESLGHRGLFLQHQALLGGEREVRDVADALEKVLTLLPARR